MLTMVRIYSRDLTFRYVLEREWTFNQNITERNFTRKNVTRQQNKIEKESIRLVRINNNKYLYNNKYSSFIF